LLLILFIPFPFSTSIASLSGGGSKIEGLMGAASLHHEVSISSALKRISV
jgi:UDP-N-acetylglucosamine--dolichyl-phosphate N-acetylglucosaminephosphotransferase